MSPEELQQLLPYTESFNLPEAQRIEIIKTVWGMMESFVHEAWGVHPVQLSCAQLESRDSQSHNPDSQSKHSPIKSTFNDHLEASHEKGKITH